MDFGLQKLDKLINHFEGLPRKVITIVDTAAKHQEQLMADLNRLQLQAGINSDGVPLPEYTEATKRIKASKGQPFDRTTLRDTGSFQDLIEAKQLGKTHVLRSRDVKTGMLVKKYGPEILGLTVENMRIVQVAMLPDIRQQLKRYMNVQL